MPLLKRMSVEIMLNAHNHGNMPDLESPHQTEEQTTSVDGNKKVSATTISEINLERQPSTLSYMLHDGSDNEENFEEIDSTAETATSLVEASSKKRVSITTVSKISLERRPSTLSYMHHDGSDNEENFEEIDSTAETATSLPLDDTKKACKVDASSNKENRGTEPILCTIKPERKIRCSSAIETKVCAICKERIPSSLNDLNYYGCVTDCVIEEIGDKNETVTLSSDYTANKQSNTDLSLADVDTQGKKLDPDKQRHQKEQTINELVSSVVLEAEVTDVGVESRPSTLSHVNHDGIVEEHTVKNDTITKTDVGTETTPSAKDSLLAKADKHSGVVKKRIDKNDTITKTDVVTEATPSAMDSSLAKADKHSGVVKKRIDKNDTMTKTDVGTKTTPSAKDSSLAKGDKHAGVVEKRNDKNDTITKTDVGTETTPSAKDSSLAKGDKHSGVVEKRNDKNDTITKTNVGTKAKPSLMDSLLAKADKHSGVVEQLIDKNHTISETDVGTETKPSAKDSSLEKGDKHAGVREKRNDKKDTKTKTDVSTKAKPSIKDSSLAKADKHDNPKKRPQNLQTTRSPSRRTARFKTNDVLLEYTEIK